MTKQVPTDCMDETCPHNHMDGIPDFMGEDEICTVHFECDLGFNKSKDCHLIRREEEEK